MLVQGYRYGGYDHSGLLWCRGAPDSPEVGIRPAMEGAAGGSRCREVAQLYPGGCRMASDGTDSPRRCFRAGEAARSVVCVVVGSLREGFVFDGAFEHRLHERRPAGRIPPVEVLEDLSDHVERMNEGDDFHDGSRAVAAKGIGAVNAGDEAGLRPAAFAVEAG